MNVFMTAYGEVKLLNLEHFEEQKTANLYRQIAENFLGGSRGPNREPR